MIWVVIYRKNAVIAIGNRAVVLRFIALASIAPIAAAVLEESALSEMVKVGILLPISYAFCAVVTASLAAM